MKKPAAIALLAAGLACAWLAFWPTWVDPVAWSPGANPGWSGAFAPDASGPAFHTIEIGPGPEDVALGPDSLFYTGLKDGRIVRFRADGTPAGEFARTGGRPLGLGFDAGGHLVVADRDRGLLRISPAGQVEILADSAGDRRIGFADDLDIARDGTIWFSDLTSRFPEDMHMDAWEGTASGRLLVFDPRSRATTVAADSLHYPNGVAFGPGEHYILVCEMLAARITRLWLRGPHAGRREAFAENLPGHPDNLSLDPDGFFWVALVGERSRAYERFAPYPALRKAATRIPGLRVPHPMPWLRAHQYAGCVVAADTAGNILASLHDPAQRYGAITSVNRYGRDVFVGSIAMPSVARISWPDVKLRHGPDNRR